MGRLSLVVLAVLTGEEGVPNTTTQQVHAEQQADARVEFVRDTDTVFAMTPFHSLEEWEAYAGSLRRRILVSCGLWPLPERTPMNPVVTGRIGRGDYLIENVYIQARPGFYVTGNLYRPPGDGPFAAVACPHGHWGHGRFENSETGSIAARCITFARMGIVSFSYDMVGYNDSRQFARAWGHDYGAIPKEDRRRQALWGIHPFALQLWSSLRVIDFLESLPYVDRDRIGCTGASGGGTQTFALCAVDPRIRVAAPVNMVSHTMQGGCVCENAPILRMNASNMEIGALMAPKPLLLVSATGDWTSQTPEVEYPAIRGIYALYGVEDRVQNRHFQADHNYNRDSREAVYEFFGKWLLNREDTYREFREPPYTMEPVESLRVFPEERLPDGAFSPEEVIADLVGTTWAKWAAILPRSPEEVPPFRARYGRALTDVIGATVPASDDLLIESLGSESRAGATIERLVLGRKGVGDRVEAAFIEATDRAPSKAVLVAHGEGLAALIEEATGNPGPLVQALLAEDAAVLAIDAFPASSKGQRKYGKFPDTFLPTDAAYAVQDVLTGLAHLRGRSDLSEAARDSLSVVGVGGGGLWCLFASALDETVRATVIDLDQFDTQDDGAWVSRCYVPCIRSIGDAITAAILISPRTLWLTNTAATFDATLVAAAFPSGALHVQDRPLTPAELAAALR